VKAPVIPAMTIGRTVLVMLGSALLACAQAGSQSAVGPDAGLPNGSPSGHDCALDGAVVNAATGEPVPRARLYVSVAGAGGGTGAEATADGGGKWSFPAAPCGPAQLVVTRPGFLPYVYGQRQGRPVIQTTLFAGMPLHDVKIELVPQAVVTGHVLDDAGDPVVNATVSVMALRVVDGRLSFQQAAGVNTNDIGEFRLANLAKGRYIVCARRNAVGSQLGTLSQAARDTLADSCYPGPLEGGMSSAMEIAAGRETQHDFNLVRSTSVHVRGTVSGQPKGRGFGLTLMRGGAGTSGPGYGVNYPGTVRPDGAFDIAGVPPGPYVLTGNLFEGGRRLFARVPVNVGQADVNNLEVQMQEGFALTAFVRIDSATDPPPAVPQFSVSLRPVEQGLGGGQVKWSDDHRQITFSDLTPGEYQLVAIPVAPYYVKAATIGGQDILRSAAALGANPAELDVILRDDGGSIEGDVSDDQGNPLSGGIMAVPRAGRPVTGFASAGGYFKLQNVEPGDYTVYAWDDPNAVAWADADWMRLYATRSVSVTVTPGATVPAKLTRIDVPTQ